MKDQWGGITQAKHSLWFDLQYGEMKVWLADSAGATLAQQGVWHCSSGSLSLCLRDVLSDRNLLNWASTPLQCHKGEPKWFHCFPTHSKQSKVFHCNERTDWPIRGKYKMEIHHSGGPMAIRIVKCWNSGWCGASKTAVDSTKRQPCEKTILCLNSRGTVASLRLTRDNGAEKMCKIYSITAFSMQLNYNICSVNGTTSAEPCSG